MASLLIETLRQGVRTRRFVIHDFVVMPDHVHILLTVSGETTVEKAVQWIKGSFSFRARKELGYMGEIWQRGFSDVRVRDARSLQQHHTYIDENPVKAGLALTAEEYPYGSAYLKKLKRSGAKAQDSFGNAGGTTEVMP